MEGTERGWGTRVDRTRGVWNVDRTRNGLKRPQKDRLQQFQTSADEHVWDRTRTKQHYVPVDNTKRGTVRYNLNIIRISIAQ